MEIKMYENLSDVERLLLESLGLIKAKRNVEVVTEYKIIKGVSKCKLCKTVTTQVIKMMKVGEGTWVKQAEIPVSEETEEALTYEEYETEVRLCWACRDKLMEKSKEELVDLVIKLYNPILSRQEIWKEVRKLKEEQKHE
jgi:hypothetical protein